mgnify:CR=1 FL=1
MSLFGKPREDAEFVALRQRVETAEKATAALQEAFNAFFDAVAADLGYMPKKQYCSFFLDPIIPTSPRRLAVVVTPEKREIVRNPTARCAGRTKKAPSAKEKSA